MSDEQNALRFPAFLKIAHWTYSLNAYEARAHAPYTGSGTDTFTKVVRKPPLRLARVCVFVCMWLQLPFIPPISALIVFECAAVFLTSN